MACCGIREGAESPAAASPAAVASTPPSPCCPASGLGPAAEPEGYEPKGSMQDLGGISCYVVGQGTSAVVVAHDVFGLRSGRTRQICDELAAALSVYVVAPVFWENEGCCGGERSATAISEAMGCPGQQRSDGVWSSMMKIKSAVYHAPSWYRQLKTTKWDVVGPKLHDQILPVLKGWGVGKIGVLGFCWGGWVAFKSSSSEQLCCAVSCHPSQVDLCGLHSDNFRQVCEDIKCPQMVLSAGDDKKDTKTGGLAEKVLSTKAFGGDCVFKTFDDMKHGWVNRGELTNPTVARDYKEAYDLFVGFFQKHLS